ncbi:gliding motility-associated C-terminal domain-containing protein [Mucilaginibacter sabulilitoris]|uniref:Gliding motility-associated C-terminal domain-containing protein n=1 Tax=Mucilaginibacter sabulilitoris TaxID=1173583 RepID=A0ABZ0TQA4_9SPHI|nr:gliding motility-associated C-terminal domain-containing protein [Mucilaginibacter sabulilitoris]WPU95079.1 gliding motility-associated C-terminal domain-containing protein [Mucilaginibacter sabulilitoris]
MRPPILKLFLLLLFALAFGSAAAQVCSGGLGDPVINQDFGSGAGTGDPLTDDITTLTYTTNCPEDGSYTITHYSGGCHNTWHTVYTDHTGNTNGFFMMINASYAPSVFFTQKADVLCENTTYEFSAYVLNLLTAQASDNTVIHPEIVFSVETITGQVLKTYDTGIIPPTSTPVWVKDSLFFTTPPGVTQVVVKMTNKAPGGNGNDLLLDDITFRACGPIVQVGFTTIEANEPKNQCVGETKTYTLKAKVNEGYTNPKIQWQQDKGDGGGWIDIAGATNDTYSFTIGGGNLGVFKYRLAAAEGQNINSANCKVFSNALTVTVNPYPVVATIEPQTQCEGDAVMLNATGGATYEWSGPGITAANKHQNPLVFNAVTPAAAGNYTVIVTSEAGCSSTAHTSLAVNSRPVVTVEEPTTICMGNSTTLNASAPGNNQYSWSPATGLSDPNVRNPVANPTQTTAYTVKVTNDKQCFTTKTVTLTVLPPPIADAGGDKKIFEGQSVKLDGSAKFGDVYSWTPVDYLSDPHSLNPIASPVDDITYTLHVTSNFNCGTDENSVFVRVYKKVVVPNTFSPNGDGVNDFWDIEALVTYPQSLLTVYNRYGRQVYSSRGYDQPWKGTYNGNVLPTGTYYYVIDLKSGAPLLSGWVQIIK